jgi:hypothetical protein
MLGGTKTQAQDRNDEAPDFERGSDPIEWPSEDHADGEHADFGADLGDAEMDAGPAGAAQIEAPILELTPTKPDRFPYLSYILLFLVTAAASAAVVLAIA